MISGRFFYVGGVVVDLVYHVDALPKPGAEVIASRSFAGAAGGFNTMAAASRSGATVVYCGHHGTGVNGETIRAALQREAITALQSKTPDRDSGSCVVLVAADGERSFVYAPGCEFSVRREGLEGLEPQPADWVLVSGYSLAEAASGTAIAEWLKAAGTSFPVVFDPSPLVDRIAPATLSAILKRTSWLTCNADEGRLLTGLADPYAAAAKLFAEFCPQAAGILLRMGSAGCLLHTAGQGTTHIPACKTTAIDTTGAGDTHSGAFIAAMASGLSAEGATVYANAAAAICVTRAGGASAPGKSEILQFLEQRHPKIGGYPTEFPTGSVAPHLGGLTRETKHVE